MAFIQSPTQLNVFKALLHLVCLTPALWVFWQGAQDQLGADPVKYLIHFYGKGAIHCLFATLLVSLLARHFKTPLLIRCRRLLGLYAFFYMCLHMLSFMMFEWQWNWAEIGAEIVKRPYMTVGFAAWLFTLPLAITSLQVLQRKMGAKWVQLHALVYPVFALGLVHFYWSQKSPWNEAIIYCLLGLCLLACKRNKLFTWLKLVR